MQPASPSPSYGLSAGRKSSWARSAVPYENWESAVSLRPSAAKRRIRAAGAAALAAVASAALTAGSAVAAPAPAAPAPDFDALRQSLNSVVTAGSPGAFALVSDRAGQGGQVSVGTGDLATRTPVNPRGQFRVGSITKYVLSCGVQVYGHDGIIEGYQTYSYTTKDGSRQLTVSADASNNSTVFAAERTALDPVFCGAASSPAAARQAKASADHVAREETVGVAPQPVRN